jgi:glycosyltransferase involved in cell wall biosynthesis
MADRNYRALPLLEACREIGPRARGHVSIIVPARNESGSLDLLLKSLERVNYPDYDVTVVDDCSFDGTALIAEDARVRTIKVKHLPKGWVGKSFACWTGAQATKGEWLLFTDADTVHGPETLGLSLCMADSFQAGLTSLLARQRCETFWERLLLPYAYALYFAGASGVNTKPGRALANGQYMLFRRSEYERIGGHRAVAGSLIEDVALASLSESHGVRLVLARAEKHLEVRMYSSLRSLWEGFTKNSFRMVLHSPRSGMLTVLASLSFLSAFPRGMRSRSTTHRFVVLATPTFCLLPWVRRFGAPWGYAALYPLAAFVFQVLALDSIRRTVVGQSAVWKGRRYG